MDTGVFVPVDRPADDTADQSTVTPVDDLPTDNPGDEDISASTSVAEWDPHPANNRDRSRGDASLHAPIGPDAEVGFTFDFKKIDVPPVARDSRSAEPKSSRLSEPEPGAAQDPDFPIPEFGLGLPVGRGPAAEGSDATVEGGAQDASFHQIMDENFTPPPRDLTERPTTPLARDGRPHLVALDGASAANERPAPAVADSAQPTLADEPQFRRPKSPEAIEPPVRPSKIVHPEIFASRGPATPTSQETLEYDVLRDGNSAEESAQLAWSEQFVRGDRDELDDEFEREEDTSSALEREPESFDAAPQPVVPIARLELAPAIEPIVAEDSHAELPEEPEAATPPAANRAAPSSEQARSHSIGPPTIEFRPVVDPDNDDPDDFAGAI
jgi:hypothetical protein